MLSDGDFDVCETINMPPLEVPAPLESLAGSWTFLFLFGWINSGNDNFLPIETVTDPG